jgi:hypothetical protein
MNIAILFYGELRWNEVANRTFQERFAPALQGHNVQYFAHFWDMANKDHEERFAKMYSPLISKIEPHKSAEELKTIWGATSQDPILGASLTSQLYSFHQSLQLLKEFQEAHNMTFDLFIKIRTDIAYLSPISVNDFDDSSLYVDDTDHWKPMSSYIRDWIFFTRKYSNVVDMAETGFCLDDLIKTVSETKSEAALAPEEIFARRARNMNITVKPHSFRFTLARYHQ